jgi:hypothetical protein
MKPAAPEGAVSTRNCAWHYRAGEAGMEKPYAPGRGPSRGSKDQALMTGLRFDQPACANAAFAGRPGKRRVRRGLRRSQGRWRDTMDMSSARRFPFGCIRCRNARHAGFPWGRGPRDLRSDVHDVRAFAKDYGNGAPPPSNTNKPACHAEMIYQRGIPASYVGTVCPRARPRRGVQRQRSRTASCRHSKKTWLCGDSTCCSLCRM